MTAKYYVTLTDYGASLIAKSHNGSTIALNQMVIGDANDQPYDPITQKSRTTLVNQTASVPIQSVQNMGQVARVIATIGANIGGFNFHEYGFTDANNKLVYIANYHGGYKPIISEGAGGELEIITDITANAGAQALLQLDPTVVSANKKWVLEQLEILKKEMIERHDIEVGDLFLTTKRFESAKAVAQFKGYGAWQRFGDGHALVTSAQTGNLTAAPWMFDTSDTGGSDTVTLTIDNLPEHNHDFINTWAARADQPENLPEGAVRLGDGDGHANDDATDSLIRQVTSKVGVGQAFNVMQNSIIIDAWKRLS